MRVSSPTDAESIEPYARALGDSLVAGLPAWVEQAIVTRTASASAAEIASTQAQALDLVETDLRAFLASDIDEQTTTPLAIARRVVAPVTALLAANDVAPAQRDDHARAMHPDDTFDLMPGGFVDFGDEVQSAGIAWGAAKAHIHMKRHAPPPKRVGAIVPNIMDRSRFGDDVVFVEEGSDLDSLDLRMLIVDLDRVGDLSELVSPRFPSIGFGSHVDEKRLAQAGEAGFAEAMARSIFFRRLPEILEGARS